MTAVQYLDALHRLQTWTRKLVAWWEDHDVLVLATMPVLPTPLGAFDGPPDNPLAGMAMSTTVVLYTAPFNISGQPAISLPMHWSEEGLPVGVQLVALGDDVDGFQPPGQVVAVFVQEIVIYRGIVPVYGGEEIGNGRAEARFVQGGDAGLPGSVIGKKFGVTLPQR